MVADLQGGDALAYRLDDAAETEMAILQDLIVSVRNIRAELKIENKARVPIKVFGDVQVRDIIQNNREAIEKLAKDGGDRSLSIWFGNSSGCVATTVGRIALSARVQRILCADLGGVCRGIDQKRRDAHYRDDDDVHAWGRSLGS